MLDKADQRCKYEPLLRPFSWEVFWVLPCSLLDELLGTLSVCWTLPLGRGGWQEAHSCQVPRALLSTFGYLSFLHPEGGRRPDRHPVRAPAPCSPRSSGFSFTVATARTSSSRSATSRGFCLRSTLPALWANGMLRAPLGCLPLTRLVPGAFPFSLKSQLPVTDASWVGLGNTTACDGSSPSETLLFDLPSFVSKGHRESLQSSLRPN